MSSLADLREGDLAFGPIHGFVGAGVGLAQLALATVEPGLIWRQGVKQWFRKRHCGVITKAGAVPSMVQAMPGGAEEIELRPETHWTDEWVFLRPDYARADSLAGVSAQANLVASEALSYIGTPYDFLTYGAIPPYRAGLRAKALEEIISGTDTMMCSRLVDASLAAAGYHLFDDGRLPGDVTPSEAYRRLLQLPHSVLLPAHADIGWVQARP